MNDQLQVFDRVWDGLIRPAVHGGADDPGGGLAGLIETMLTAITNLVESGASISLLPGIRALATNVHPLIVHFPIAFLTAYFLLEVLGLVLRRPAVRQIAGWMLYFGAAATAVAVAAGLVAAAAVPHGGSVHEVMEWHERLMLTVCGLAITLAVWRAVAGAAVSAMAIGLNLFLATAMVVLMVFGADLGGLMVYRYGVGVASLQGVEEVHEHVHTPEMANE